MSGSDTSSDRDLPGCSYNWERRAAAVGMIVSNICL
jgi:hypothetical protein